MNLSAVFVVQENTFKFSFDGKFLAYAFDNTVFIGTSWNRTIVRSFHALDVVQDLQWSSDSEFIMCGLYQLGVIEVVSVRYQKWKCKIREGDIGVKQALWSPDDKHILTVGKFNMAICVWSLSNLCVECIYNLVSTPCPVLEFSCDGKWLATVEKNEHLFSLAIFSSATWKLTNRCTLDDIQIIGGLAWSPDNSIISVWERRVDICRVLFMNQGYNAFHKYEKNALGIKVVDWAPSGQFVALFCYNGKVRLLNHVTWNEFVVLSHEKIIPSPLCSVYEETTMTSVSVEKLFQHPVVISSSNRDCLDINCHYGTHLTQFSAYGQFLATHDNCAPATVWIWNIPNGILHTVLAFRGLVLDFVWNPVITQIAVLSENAVVCVWSPHSGASIIRIPYSDLWSVRSAGLQWHPQRHTLAVSAGNTMVLLWIPEETNCG